MARVSQAGTTPDRALGVLAVAVICLGLACQARDEVDEEAPPSAVVQQAEVPPSDRSLEHKVEPITDVSTDIKPEGVGTTASPAAGQTDELSTGSWTRPLSDEGTGSGLAGREVDLRMNGERVRVVRPSLANPFVVASGEYDDGPVTLPAEAGGAAAPQLVAIQQRNIDVIRRVPQLLTLSLEDPDGIGDLRGYYVQFDGYPGHFFVPAQLDSEVFGAGAEERGRVNIGFFMDEVFPPGGERDVNWAARYNQPFDVRMTVWAVDRAQHVSQPVVQNLHVLPVGRGDLEVTLSMSLPTDLDLYVVEPNGNVIYYNNMRSWTNGQLDLDANAACSSNTNVRYEHIFWPEGGVPEGTYRIRVDNWANCVSGQPVDYQVIIQNCGDITIHEGTAVGPGGRNDCVNRNMYSCQDIAAVEVRPCEELSAGTLVPNPPVPKSAAEP